MPAGPVRPDGFQVVVLRLPRQQDEDDRHDGHDGEVPDHGDGVLAGVLEDLRHDPGREPCTEQGGQLVAQRRAGVAGGGAELFGDERRERAEQGSSGSSGATAKATKISAMLLEDSSWNIGNEVER